MEKAGYRVSYTSATVFSLSDENNDHKSQYHYTAEPEMAEPTAVDIGSCRYMLQCSLKTMLLHLHVSFS